MKFPTMPEPGSGIISRLTIVNGFWDRWEKWMVAAGLATSALPWLKTEGMQMADAFFTLVRKGDPRYSQLNGSAMTSVPSHVVADYKVPHVQGSMVKSTASW